MNIPTLVIAAPAALKIIEDAREAEVCRDIKGMRRVLEPIWPDINEDPVVSNFPSLIQAKLLRLAGFLLTFTAKSRSISSYHPRAKDLLTRAVSIFEEEGLRDEAAEARVILAWAFWHSGEVDECGMILTGLEREFSEELLNPVRTQILINRLMFLVWSQRYQEAAEIVESLRLPIESCQDGRLRAMFHNEAGVLCRQTGAFEDAIFHYNAAIRWSREIRNQRFVGINLNNLAMVHKSTERFPAAHMAADAALHIFTELGDVGWMAMVNDTRSQIFLAEDRLTEALASIEDAIIGFEQGEDWANLIESLWVKCRCLFRSGRSEEAFLTYTELQDIAATRIGSVATHRFAREIAHEVYVLNSLPFDAEVSAFRKSLVSQALIDSYNALGAAAKRLGMSHQKLSDIINKQYPELYDELGIKRRSRRADSKRRALRELLTDSCDVIRISDMNGVQVRGTDAKCGLYYCSVRIMQNFGLEEEAVVAIAPFRGAAPDIPIAYMIGDDAFVARIQFEPTWGKIFFVLHKDEPLPLNELNIVGIPTAFCLLEDVKPGVVEFRSLTL